MTYENFLKITLNLQRQSRILDDLNENNVNLVNFTEPYHAIISILIKEIYGEEGLEWFDWFCYVTNFGTKNLSARDENGKPICYSFESLWEYLESTQNKTK